MSNAIITLNDTEIGEVAGGFWPLAVPVIVVVGVIVDQIGEYINDGTAQEGAQKICDGNVKSVSTRGNGQEIICG